MLAATFAACSAKNADVRRGDSEKYLYFTLSHQPFSLPLAAIREVMSVQPIQTLEGGPPYLAGVIRVRRSLIPVIDLRKKFGLRAPALKKRNCILLIGVADGLERIQVGLIVDGVSAVVTIEEHEIRDRNLDGPPELSCVAGAARVHGRTNRILDADALLSRAELAELHRLVP